MPTLVESAEPGTLYVVATPIGHLGDLSPRAAHFLQTVDFVCAEDTRHTAQLAQLAGLKLPALVSLHEHNEGPRAAGIVQRLRAGETSAVVTDAGTPLVSDPGYILVRAAIEADLRVVPIPGPCAALTALTASGLPPEPFIFAGFPPKRGDRIAWLRSQAAANATVAIYVPARDLQVWLDSLAEALPSAQVAVARELTKRHETIYRGTAGELVVPEAERRGEAVLLFHWRPAEGQVDQESLLADVQSLLGKGLSRRDALTAVATLRNASRSELQRVAHLRGLT